MNRKEIIEALNSQNNEILHIADKIRKENVGDNVLLRALVEFSSYCRRNCNYCGLRLDNVECVRYRLNKDEIVHFAKRAVELGLKTVVLQSGEDYFFKESDLVEIIREIKKLNVALTLSIGERPMREYEAFKDAGADRFLMRIETTNEALYSKMHPDTDLKGRIKHILKLKELGFELGTGSLIGLPEQTVEMIADDILFFKEIGADMIGTGPFIPSAQTPLKDAQRGSFEFALKVVALSRIVLPKANIPATTAMETIHPEGRLLTLQSGANVVMPNVVDYNINKNYSIYENKASNRAGVEETLKKIKERVESIGRIAD